MMLMEVTKTRMTGETPAVITLLMRRSRLALIASMLTAAVGTHAARSGSLSWSVPTR